MNFTRPKDGYSIYTTNNCNYCTHVKSLLPNAYIIAADNYITENREHFLAFVDNLSGKRPRTFPMVFLNKRFIGGFKETKLYIDELESFKFVEF